VRFFAILAKNNGGIISYYRYICHFLNNRATVWHIRATTLPPFAKLANFAATIVAFNAKKVAYQCHPTLIFATCWQISSIFLLQNFHRLNLSANLATLRATEWHSMPKSGISMPPYFYFCHHVENSCHILPPF